MKALFIGGTGTISTAISREFLETAGNTLVLLNRGNRNDAVRTENTRGELRVIQADISDESAARAKLAEETFDVVADFITFTREQVERDWRLFRGKTAQYIAISSASAYQKPLSSAFITEGTPLANPYWQYSRDKIAVEDFLMAKYREEGFPVTIVRPSHTYDERKIPLGVHGKNGSWQVVRRIMAGKPVIIHGDGTSLWTLTHSRDFAGAFIGLMGNIHAIGEAVQITGDETLSWNQIYAAIAGAVNAKLQAVHISSDFLAAAGPDYDFTGSLTGDKAASVIFDNTKLKRLVPGYHSKIRFDQGVRETIQWCLAHQEEMTEDPEFDAWCDRVIAAREAALRSLGG
jgi:nucleoside-diphosphate-sugar epimerase